jgi:hypothetical protein
VAQLICEKACIPQLIESEKELPGTKRGAGGFGSTGGHKSVEKEATEDKKDVEASGYNEETEEVKPN